MAIALTLPYPQQLLVSVRSCVISVVLQALEKALIGSAAEKAFWGFQGDGGVGMPSHRYVTGQHLLRAVADLCGHGW